MGVLQEVWKRFSSRVDVDLDAIVWNYRLIAQRVAPSEVIPVIKANALGFGGPIIGLTLQAEGTKTLAVSNFSEALELRSQGITTGILVMNGLVSEEMSVAVDKDISFFVFDEDSLIAADRVGRSCGKPARVHVKIDTGMGRLGIMPEHAGEFRKLLQKCRTIEVEGVASHLASPYLEEHDEFSRRQFRLFVEAAYAIDPGHKAKWHIAASSGVIRFPEMYLDAVRPGALLHGLSRIWPLPWPLKRAGSFRAKIAQVKELPPGHNVGYRLHWTTPRKTKLGVVPIGTVDGLSGEHADNGYVLIGGRRCRIVGICSCQMMIDLTEVRDVSPGTEVTVFGHQGEDEITVVECATFGGTSYANITARISRRIPRVYWKGGSCVAIDINGDIEFDPVLWRA
ncbi:MAG TPA: alanine racemase [Firmicutes bacterium]|nr:alanine racemase [Candidatus Fermentithermobacillaceae bacterium]